MKTNRIVYDDFHDRFMDLPDEIIQLIILDCTDLGKFVINFVSKRFEKLTENTVVNRQLGISFVSCFWKEHQHFFQQVICRLAAAEGSINILKWMYHNLNDKDETDYRACEYAAKNGARLIYATKLHILIRSSEIVCFTNYF